MKFLYGYVSPFLCTRHSVMMILNLSESLAKPLVMAKLNMAYLSSLKNQQNCCHPHCPRHITVPFGAEAPSGHVVQAWAIPPLFWNLLSQQTDNDDSTRDERSVLRPNPATFLRDFMLYMTTNYAIIWKRCLNYTARITLSTPVTSFGVIRF